MDLEYLKSELGKELIGILANDKKYNCLLLHGDECINDGDCANCLYSEEIQSCKKCRFFGIKDRKMYWCFAPELQEIKRQDFLEIKYEEIEDRCCEYFQRKLM